MTDKDKKYRLIWANFDGSIAYLTEWQTYHQCRKKQSELYGLFVPAQCHISCLQGRALYRRYNLGLI